MSTTSVVDLSLTCINLEYKTFKTVTLLSDLTSFISLSPLINLTVNSKLIFIYDSTL